jgi:hypothetical protein
MRPFVFLAAFGLLSVAATSVQADCYYTQKVQGWYSQYLHRPLDPLGAQTWVAQLYQGVPEDYVLASILGSEEYYCRHGHTPQGFVTGLYGDVIGRTPCAHTVNYWCGKLSRCGCRIEFCKEFLHACHHGTVDPLAAPVVPVAPVVVPRPVFVPQPVVIHQPVVRPHYHHPHPHYPHHPHRGKVTVRPRLQIHLDFGRRR